MVCRKYGIVVPLDAEKVVYCKVVAYSYETPPRNITWDVRTELKVDELPSSTIIKGSWQVEERKNIEADVYNALNGAFGTPDCLYCIQGSDREASSWSNKVWLPSKEDIPKHFWKVGSKPQPQDVERRYLVLTCLATEGEQCTEAKQAKDLVENLVHSALGAASFSRALDLSPTYYDPLGWWSVFNAGYLHRDVSIGNVLAAKEPFNSKQAFSFDVERLIARCGTAPASSSGHHHDPFRQKIEDRIREEGKEIEKLLRISDIAGGMKNTKAFIMDFDIATSWEDYFARTHRGTISVRTCFSIRVGFGR